MAGYSFERPAHCKFCGALLIVDSAGIHCNAWGKDGRKCNDTCPKCGAGYNRFQPYGAPYSLDNEWDEPGTHPVEVLSESGGQ